MGTTILRPSTRILTPGSRGIRYAQPGGGAAAPWWMAAGVAPIVAYQAKGAASYAASKVNLAQPGTYNATEGVAPSWAAETGWTFDGISQYLRTQLAHGDTGQNWSMFVRFSNLLQPSVGAATLMGEGYNGASHFDLFPWRFTGTNQYMMWCNGGNQHKAVTNRLAGVMGLAGNRCYWNGVDEGLLIPTGTQQYVEIVFCRSILGACLSCAVAAAIAYNSPLDGSQSAMISAAMAAL